MADLIIRIIADGLVVLVVLIGASAFLIYVKTDRYQRYAKAFMAGLTTYTIGRIFSIFYEQTDRPFVLLGLDPKAAYLDNPGFPSDHALFVTAIALITWAATGRKKISLVLAAMCLLVAFGRVIALVHATADVIGGIAAAVIGVAIWYGFETVRPKANRY